MFPREHSQVSPQFPPMGGVSQFFRCEAPFLLRHEIECRITPSLLAQKALTPPQLQASLQAPPPHPSHPYLGLYGRVTWKRPAWHVASSESRGSPLSGMRMDQITADDVETTKFHESPHSRNCAIRTLRRMLGKARDWKVLREVPRIKTVKVFPRDRMVTVEDEKRLLAACKRPLKDVLTIMLDSGLRNGEVVRMRWETINWEGAFYFNPRGKTRKARRPVPLSERVLTLLRNVQHEQSRRREGWVFPSKKSRSGHIGLSGLEHMFRSVARKLEIPDALKLYCARHIFGTVAMAETKNPGLVKEVMGHESLTTTMGYLHPETAQIKVVIDRLNSRSM